MTVTMAAERSRDVAGRDIPILRSGILAREFCQRGDRAEVVAVFERSIYLRSAEMFVCIGEPSIGNGPVTLIADFGSSNRLPDLRLHPGCTAAISDRCIAVGDSTQFTFDKCELWRPPAWRLPWSRVELTNVCDRIVCLAAIEAPEEGFSQVYRLPVRETPLARIARPRIARFESWLYGELHTRHASTSESSQVIQGLIGLGPGLTPSGDDFLVGALALLEAFAERKTHAALAHAITVAPHDLTSPLSDYLLRTAAAGHVGEDLWCAVSAVISGGIEPAVASIRKIGHGSGWDMLFGVATTLQVVATALLQHR